MVKTNIEFNGKRAELYEKAICNYPNARIEDVIVMKRLLKPEKGEKILGLGEGNGYFCKEILLGIGLNGRYIVTDPSIDQLNNLKLRVSSDNLEVICSSGEELTETLEIHEQYDKIWSFGAFHHIENQTKAMSNCYNALRKGGKLVLCDVFQGSKLAEHFDSQVARYCIAGHEVKFLSEKFAKTLCLLSGFQESKISIIDLPQRWVFDSEKDLGIFIYNLHAMTKISGKEEEKIQEVIRGCKEILGIEKVNGKYYLNWPMKALLAEK